MQRLASEGQMGLAEGLVLGWVGVHEGATSWRTPPSLDQLSLADELSDAVAHHVHADDGAVHAAYELDEARGAEDLALAVAAEVVGDASIVAVAGRLRPR